MSINKEKPPLFTSLVVRERNYRIMQMYADGKRADEISKEIHLSPRTIEGVLRKMYWHHDANTLPHLVAILLREGLIK